MVSENNIQVFNLNFGSLRDSPLGRWVSKPIPQSFTIAVVLTGVLLGVTSLMGAPVNWWETAAVFFSFACTWLCVRQSRFNYWLGIVSTALLSYVFFTTGLYGSMALNLYLVPTLIYGWFIWGKDVNTKPVEHVKPRVVPVYVIVTVVTWAGAFGLITLFGGKLSILDGWLLIGSILAQYLLDRKKIETWMVWVAVDVVSVYVYFQSGLYLLAFQFSLFLLNAVYAWFVWRKSMRNHENATKDEIPPTESVTV